MRVNISRKIGNIVFFISLITTFCHFWTRIVMFYLVVTHINLP